MLKFVNQGLHLIISDQVRMFLWNSKGTLNGTVSEKPLQSPKNTNNELPFVKFKLVFQGTAPLWTKLLSFLLRLHMKWISLVSCELWANAKAYTFSFMLPHTSILPWQDVQATLTFCFSLPASPLLLSCKRISEVPPLLCVWTCTVLYCVTKLFFWENYWQQSVEVWSTTELPLGRKKSGCCWKEGLLKKLAI